MFVTESKEPSTHLIQQNSLSSWSGLRPCFLQLPSGIPYHGIERKQWDIDHGKGQTQPSCSWYQTFSMGAQERWEPCTAGYSKQSVVNHGEMKKREGNHGDGQQPFLSLWTMSSSLALLVWASNERLGRMRRPVWPSLSWMMMLGKEVGWGCWACSHWVSLGWQWYDSSHDYTTVRYRALDRPLHSQFKHQVAKCEVVNRKQAFIQTMWITPSAVNPRG